MKITIALLAATLGASIPLQGANADQNRDTALNAQSQDTLSQTTDVSAAKKKRHHRVHVYPERYAYYHMYPRAFSQGDPSYQSPELVRLRSLNRCVFDLGYGRWENCN